METGHRLLSVDGPWTWRDITVTCTRDPAPELVDEFTHLYEEGFGPMRTVAAARQVLTADEFREEMLDDRVWKYVAFDDEGRRVGLTTLTDVLETVPWISPDYFRDRYPEHAARGAIFYLGFTLVMPSMRHRPVFFAMMRPATQRVAVNKGVCAYDVCGFNDSSLSLGAGLERLLHRMADVKVEAVDVQTYYAASFTGTLTQWGAA